VTRAAFLNDPHVRKMLEWFCQQYPPSGSFTHAYRDRASGERWSCRGFHQAFTTYRWNDKSWLQNKKQLGAFRSRLRQGLSSRDRDDVFQACTAILRWGGVWANNGRYLERRRPVIIQEIEHLADVLARDHEPTQLDIRRNPSDKSTECRMNAGFVKIYSVLLDHFVIYDGRVGAALGLLTRQFCEQTGRTEVPASLRFAYGSPKEGLNPTEPKIRNPTNGNHRFPKLRNDPHQHTVQAMRASWFLRAAIESDAGPFTQGEDGFHEIAAGLFMIGYDLPPTDAIRPAG
jgi:hypothetical protein